MRLAEIAARAMKTLCKALAPLAPIGLCLACAPTPASAQPAAYDNSVVTYNEDASENVDFAALICSDYGCGGEALGVEVANFDPPWLAPSSYTGCNCTAQTLGPAYIYYYFGYDSLEGGGGGADYFMRLYWEIFAPGASPGACTATCCTGSTTESILYNYWALLYDDIWIVYY